MAFPLVPSELGPVLRDYEPSAVPHDLLAGVWASHARLGALVAGLDDAAVRRPSSLPGWSVGHLLTHLARNADSHTGMVAAAGRGEAIQQYPGGGAQRGGDIASGAGRPVEALVADLLAAQRRLEQAWDATHVATWRSGYGLTASLGPTSLAGLVLLRWREVEVHTVDLGLSELGGPTWNDLPHAYLDHEWPWCVARLPARLPPGTSVLLAPGDRPSVAVRSELGPVGGAGQAAGAQDASQLTVLVEAPTREIFHWFTGRGGDPSWPPLSAWT